jgi:hypothetical protein
MFALQVIALVTHVLAVRAQPVRLGRNAGAAELDAAFKAAGLPGWRPGGPGGAAGGGDPGRAPFTKVSVL